MTADALEAARATTRRARAAQERADAMRKERDAAVLAAFRAGVKPPTIAAATNMTLSNVRKVLREAAQQSVDEALPNRRKES